MSSNLTIAMSGASHSGKTTFMKKIKNKYPNDVVFLDEEIRKINIGNIDKIRKSPKKYLDLEIKIINMKIEAEKEINFKYKNKVVLIDRSLIDSYFYFTFFVDKAKLSTKNQYKYFNFMSFIYENINNHINTVYDRIYFLSPIKNITRKDKYTQKNLSILQTNEYFHMLLLTKGATEKIKNKVKYFNAKTDYELMESEIKNFIKEKNK